MKRSAWLALSLVGLLVACTNVPQKGQPMNATEAKAVSGLALSGDLVGDPYSLTKQDVQALGISPVAASALEATGMNLAQAVSAGCKLDIGNCTDQDLDFIPTDFSITVSGCSYTDTSTGFGYSFEGGLRLQDTSRTAASS